VCVLLSMHISTPHFCGAAASMWASGFIAKGLDAKHEHVQSQWWQLGALEEEL